MAFAAWAGKRLPTADEWEIAARGRQGRVYPWGDRFIDGICNTNEEDIGGPSPIDSFPRDRSFWGIIGMGGNVTEWTSTRAPESSDGDAYIVSGGSWLEWGEAVAISALRRNLDPDECTSDVGFRCAK